MEQPDTEDFRDGENIELTTTGEYGTIEFLHSYTVLNEATGRNVTILRGSIRNSTTNVRGQVGNLRVNSQVEFQEGSNWVTGTLIYKNYLVEFDDGSLEIMPHPLLRRRIQVQAQHAIQPRPAEDAFEIHKAFADLNFNKFMTIIRRETNGASNFKNRENVLEPLLSYINSSDTSLTSEQKTRYTESFRRPTRGIIDRVNDFIRDHPNVKNDTLDVIQFVLSQDRIYKDLFIETFENECIGAYSSGSKESCTKGMWERIYLANKGTIGGLCSDEITGNASSSAAASYCKPVYLELYDAFVPGADIDIERIFMDWYNKFSYDAIPEEKNPLKNLSVDERKQHYRDFVKKDREITQRIWNNADFQNRLEKSIKINRIFETLDITGEGVKRRNGKKTNKRNRSKNIKRLKSKKQFRKK
jgi:hypothetical protein